MLRTLRGRVIITYFIVVFISLLLASTFFLFFLSRYIRDRDRNELLGQMRAMAQDVSQVAGRQPGTQPSARKPPLPEPSVAATRLLNSEAEVLKAKLLLVGPDGTVMAQSSGKPLLGPQTVKLPTGILNESGPRVTQRFFQSLKREYLFATAPTEYAGKRSFLMSLKPVEPLRLVAAPLIGYVALAGGISLLLSMLLAFYLSYALSRPIKDVAAAARSMAAGDYSVEAPVRGPEETTELARDFNLMAGRVRTAYELQRDFVGDISHELRTPLTSIEGFSQALIDGVTTSEQERQRSLEIINQESKRSVRLLRDLMLLSQIDAGGLKTDRSQIDAVDLLRKMESVYARRSEETGIQMTVAPPSAGTTLYTDADRLERVLTNLLDNAFKFTPPGGSVALSAVPDADTLAISVSDTGPGIPQESLANVFDRFYRVEKSRSKKLGGSGLGLSICRELVWTLGGTITARSLPGHGATFIVRLPL